MEVSDGGKANSAAIIKYISNRAHCCVSVFLDVTYGGPHGIKLDLRNNPGSDIAKY